MVDRDVAVTRRGIAPGPDLALHVVVDGQRVPLDMNKLKAMITSACIGLEQFADADAILHETVRNLYDGVPVEELYKSAILAARVLMEKDPAYSYVTARLLLHSLRLETIGEELTQADMKTRYAEVFPLLIKKGIEAECLAAYMEMTGMVDYVLSRDSDSIVYGAKNLISYDSKNKGFRYWNADVIKQKYNLTQEDFRKIAVILGGDFAEKNPISDNATVGIYYWAKGSDYVKYAEQMIQKDIRTNNEFYVCPVFNEAIGDNKKIKIFQIEKMWGLGTPEDLNYYLEHKV